MDFPSKKKTAIAVVILAFAILRACGGSSAPQQTPTGEVKKAPLVSEMTKCLHGVGGQYVHGRNGTITGTIDGYGFIVESAGGKVHASIEGQAPAVSREALTICTAPR